MYKYSLFFVLILFLACNEEIPHSPSTPSIPETEICDELSIDSSLIVQKDDKTILIAGIEEDDYFDITHSDIEICKLEQGLGREFFPALYQPEYEPIANFAYHDDMKCLIAYDEGEKKIYPYSVLSQHETVNEEINGEPTMIVFCELADLAALYSREYCGKTFTFAPSGFTYFDKNYWDGVQGILLWDWETESLWWPLNDKCMSGILQGVDIRKAPQQYWDYITWGEVKLLYPDAISLAHNQRGQKPENIIYYSEDDLDCP